MFDEKHQLPIVSEEDLTLIHALQIAPRAPWSQIGQVIGMDAGTAARRWARLRDERLVWFTAHASASLMTPEADAALVELSCPPDHALEVAQAVAEHADVISVDLVSGTHQIVLLVVGPNLESTRLRIAQIVAPLAQVTDGNLTFIARVHREDAQWQLRVLSTRQKRALAVEHADSPASVTPALVNELLQALGDDARMSFGNLANRLNTSEATARRMMSKIMRTEAVRLSCDVAAGAVGQGRAVILEAEVLDPEQAGTEISQLPQVVRCAEVVSLGNLYIMARFSTLAQLARFETEARERAAGWRIVRRNTVTRAVKRQGRLLDAAGRVVSLSSSSKR